MKIAHYLREQDRIVYYFHNGVEYLLFDFNARVGDTILLDIFNPFKQFSQFDTTEVFKLELVIIKEIKYRQNALGTDSLRTFLFEFLNLDRQENSSGITEIVLFNNMQTLFSFISLIDDLPSTWSSLGLRCFESDSVIYKTAGCTKPCDFSNVSIYEFETKNDIEVFPNPSKNIVNIGIANQQLKQVSVYNLIGELILKQSIKNSSHKTTIDVLKLKMWQLYITC